MLVAMGAWRTCAGCSGLRSIVSAFQKYGSPEDDTHLPAVVATFEVVRDLGGGSGRAFELRRCKACGTHYLYWTDYEFLAGGSEDEETVLRLEDDQVELALRSSLPDLRSLREAWVNGPAPAPVVPPAPPASYEPSGLNVVEAGADAPPGHLKDARGEWISIERIRAVESWIDSWLSGVRVHLDDDTTREILEYDSGNIDYTATWNEYLYDGAWAFGAGRALAQRLGVAYRDAWSERT
jgi:hypothetical protein